MSLTSCHKAGAAIRGLLGGTAVHHTVINTYTMAVSATFHSRVSTDSALGQLVRHIYLNNNLWSKSSMDFVNQWITLILCIWCSLEKNIATGVKLTLTSFYIVLERGQASQMPTLVFVTPSLWLCLAICLKLPVESLDTSCWGTLYSHLHPKCLSSPSESPLISPSPVLFDLPIIWVSTAWGLSWLFVFSSAA